MLIHVESDFTPQIIPIILLELFTEQRIIPMSNSDIALKSSLRLNNRIFTWSLCFLFGRGKTMDLHQGNK